jgi:hypothetical protein
MSRLPVRGSYGHTVRRAERRDHFAGSHGTAPFPKARIADPSWEKTTFAAT